VYSVGGRKNFKLLDTKKQKYTSVRLYKNQTPLPDCKVRETCAVKDFSVMFGVNNNLSLINMATKFHEL
jgi:hypothetical protein